MPIQRLVHTLFSLFLLNILTGQDAQWFREIPLFENGNDGYACFRIPAIIISPNGDLLAFSEGRIKGCNDFGNVDITMKRSRDNGLSWSPLSVVVDNGEIQAGNPTPVVDVLDDRYPNGRLFLFYNTGNNHEYEVRQGNGLREVWYITSTDNGESWSEPINITSEVHRPNQPLVNPSYSFKEDWRSYALAPGHAIQLQNAPYRGRLFIPANHSMGAPADHFNDYRAHAFYSDDHGQNWKLSASVDLPSSNESIAVELPDGTVMQNIRQQNGESRHRIVTLSKDGGALWDTTYIDYQLPSPVCQASILSYKTPQEEQVILFSNPESKEHRKRMTVKMSMDNGQTWPVRRLVREGNAAYSDLVALKNKDIGLLYEHGNDGGIHFAHFNYLWLIGGGE